MFKITQLRNCGINACTVVEKNVWIPQRFFDNHYTIFESVVRLYDQLSALAQDMASVKEANN